MLTSFDLYTTFPASEVVEAETVVDNCSGMNPVYYLRSCDGKLKVSTSVASLVIDSHTFEPDTGFTPPKFLLHPSQRAAVDTLRRVKSIVEHRLRGHSPMPAALIKKLRATAPDSLKTLLWNPHQAAHVSARTADRRIAKLQAFESVGGTDSSERLKLDFSIDRLEEYLERSALLLRKCINDIELAFPHKKHIILMGGKDSQLISLVPKVDEANWYVFSAEPNYPLIRDWLAQNRIHATRLFRHDGRNEETLAEFRRKIICSDLYTNLIHIRYAPTLEKIARQFDNQCIFWLGSMPRRTSLYDGSHRKEELPPRDARFFDSHLNTFPAWQGNIHQTYFNYVGCPFFSPYYLPQIWFDLYSRLEPRTIPAGADLRATLGDLLAGRRITWPQENPGPVPYKYWYFWFDTYGYYTRNLRSEVARGAKGHV